MEQRTEEWFTARLGKVTASKVADVMAKTKTGYAASRETYATQLVLERITKTKAEGFTSQAMQWGIDQEPLLWRRIKSIVGGIRKQLVLSLIQLLKWQAQVLMLWLMMTVWSK